MGTRCSLLVDGQVVKAVIVILAFSSRTFAPLAEWILHTAK